MLYTFKYSDGHSVVHTFSTYNEAFAFAFNEGDHLIEWKCLNE